MQQTRAMSSWGILLELDDGKMNYTEPFFVVAPSLFFSAPQFLSWSLSDLPHFHPPAYKYVFKM